MNVAYSTGMTLEPLGEDALILRGLPGGEAWKAAKWLEERKVPGLKEVNAAWDTVGLYVDRTLFQEQDFTTTLERMKLRKVKPGKRVEIPVCYEAGPDFERTAKLVGLTPAEFIALHTSVEYTCFAVGFCPGFPYLTGLPAPLDTLPRLEQPRARVPWGSVAIAAGQCGIYPSEKPGGWRLIGRTPIPLADEVKNEYLIAPGDRVRFTAMPLWREWEELL
jgi:inhibitor of KinA